ncbi:histidine kinase dimerization/phospho-acceptor domain-containing protein [Fredinandcohnia sp. 179-A 10B2 NHS]|uniref:sensor histidine kinase n=1 Tax=Fredinandcohnia sp. 179-A 10B2 NHS TaxID=3235176 RepID=UPI0039A04A67
MATKWKNSIWLLTSLLVTFGLIGGSVLVNNANQYLFVDYFETNNFNHERNEIWHYISKYEIYDIPFEEAHSNLIVTKGEIDVARSKLSDLSDQLELINNEYNYGIEEAKQAGETEKAEKLTVERDKELEKMRSYFEDDEYTKDQLLKEKEKELDAYYEELENMENVYEEYKQFFAFYLKDKETGEIYTNLSGKDEKYFTEETMLFIEDWDYILTPIGPPGVSLEEKKLVGKLGVKKDVSESVMSHSYLEFLKNQKVFYGLAIGGIIALLAGLFLFTKMKIKEIRIAKRFIPIDINTVLVVILGVVSFLVLWDSKDIFFYISSKRKLLFNFTILLVLVGFTLLFLKLIQNRLNDKENRKADFQNSLLYKGYKAISEAFLNRSIGVQTLLLLSVIIAFVPGGFFLANRWYNSPLQNFILLLLIFIPVAVPIIYLILKRAGYFNIILKHTSELVEGNLAPDLVVKGNSPLATLAANINELKSGVEFSQREQLKSERLKTELITNVSHDLRTPLTSIISYSELLKKPGLSEEERISYIEIIDRKSKRLKFLIEDLFEASKMASGNIELEKTRIDLNQLLEQALAEHEEKIKDSSLQFRVSNSGVPVYANIDGQKVWRVFDNLIGNILKYSLEHTRVYIQVKEEKGKAIITFKNVTKYELGENVDELFERFKRGDTSRHTEGSGLGLAIAKSIVDLHGGNMDIGLDGDLFKVTVQFDSVQ